MPIIIGALIAGGLGVAGSAISANATSNAQDAANATNAANANATNQLEWNRYLISRGINPGNIPGITGSSVNTLLPLNFTDANGQPLEGSLLSRILGISNGQESGTPEQQISAAEANFASQNPEAITWYNNIKQEGFTGTLADAVREWYRRNPGNTVSSVDSAFLSAVDRANNQANLASTNSSTATTTDLNNLLNIAPGVLTNGVYGGGFLGQEQAAAGNVADARDALAALVAQRNTEMRAKSQDILNTDLSGVADILNTRTGAIGNLYDQEMLGADTYENAVKQSTAAQLQQQLAQRARQGFVGSGSGDALTRARILASGYQAAGGARAQAGINQATRLGDAQSQAAQARLQYNDDNARRLAGILDADAASAVAQSNLQRQQDSASLISNDIARQIANLNQPLSIYNSTVSSQANAPYANINALLNTLGFFKQGQPAMPGVITPTVQPTINGAQIAGSAISGIGNTIGNYYTTQAWIDALKGNPSSQPNWTSLAGQGTGYANSYGQEEFY